DVSSKNESERDSPIIKQSGTTKKRSTQRQSRKRTRSDSNSRSRSVSDENNNTNNSSSSSTSTPRPGRKRTSIIWNHCTEKKIDGKVYTCCNYCKCKWVLNSSTSTAKSHVENGHWEKLSEAEKNEVRNKSSGKKQQTTPNSKLPVRSLVRPVTHQSSKGRELNTQLCKAIISGSLPYNILDNVQFAMFVENISSYTYNLPSRSYMTKTVTPALYRACKDTIKDILEHVPYIALTTDAWKSISKQSYITVTLGHYRNQS
ncbi:MAG: hypothetical protein GY804_09995, partial [Alphaproteobacteria bacterium]|nr:hypothetical protein [Alphaproteobacteria bacterium]